MDPNANWKETVSLAHSIQEKADNYDEAQMKKYQIVDDALRLAELVIALEEWLAKGGFPPKAFEKK